MMNFKFSHIPFSIFCLVILLLTLTSCTARKKTLNSHRSVESISAHDVTKQKKEPLPKNFVLKQSKRKILGQEYSKR